MNSPNDNGAGTAIVSIVAIIAILVVGYVAIQMMRAENNPNAGITIDLPEMGNDSSQK